MFFPEVAERVRDLVGRFLKIRFNSCFCPSVGWKGKQRKHKCWLWWHRWLREVILHTDLAVGPAENRGREWKESVDGGDPVQRHGL